MTSATEQLVTTQVYRVYIRATPEAIWDAITKPEWTQRYGYGGQAEYDLRPGGPYKVIASSEMQTMGMPEVIVDGEVVEADPPRKLVQTRHPLWSDDVVAEPATRLTYEIEEDDGGVTRLTVTHELEGAPVTAAQVTNAGAARIHEGGGGWSWLLSDLKTLLETGNRMES
jgi:uncharacterized protein YndB with AHSA1/START domain